jgi:hypothetical protein
MQKEDITEIIESLIDNCLIRDGDKKKSIENITDFIIALLHGQGTEWITSYENMEMGEHDPFVLEEEKKKEV